MACIHIALSPTGITSSLIIRVATRVKDLVGQYWNLLGVQSFHYCIDISEIERDQWIIESS